MLMYIEGSERVIKVKGTKGTDRISDFFLTRVMKSNKWNATNFELRRIYTRKVARGFVIPFVIDASFTPFPRSVNVL